MLNTRHIDNRQRLDFMLKLAASDLILDDREQSFVNHCRGECRMSWFTDGRASWTDRLWNKYGALIGMPLPLAPARITGTVTQSARQADPAGCMFLVSGDDKRQRPCNAPAVCRRNNGFRYCAEHRDEVLCRIKHNGGRMEMTPL